MKLVIQNAISARIQELRDCPPEMVDSLVTKLAENISMQLSTLRNQVAVAEAAVAVEEQMPIPTLQTDMLKAALSAMSDAGSIVDAHGLFVRRLSKSIAANMGGAAS